MRLQTLGGLRLEGADFQRPKPLLLLAYLAVEGAKDRRHLAELFWPDASEPATSLRVALGQLRKGAPGVLGGDKDPAEIVASMERGLYAVNFGGGEVDITSGKFVFSASEAYWVENGKVQYPVKGATLIGNGPDALTHVSMIGNDMALDPGIGMCGKEGQSIPVGVGQPTIRIEGLTVGGTA